MWHGSECGLTFFGGSMAIALFSGMETTVGFALSCFSLLTERRNCMRRSALDVTGVAAPAMLGAHLHDCEWRLRGSL